MILIRHGEGEHNVENTWSQTAPLTKKGYEQAYERGRALLELGFSSENIEAVYVSPRIRTRQTAQALADAGLFEESKMRLDERIAEADFGKLEGQKISSWREVGEELWDLPFAEEVGGETLEQVRARMSDFLLEMRALESSGHILVVSHGTPLRELLGLLNQERAKLGNAEVKIIGLDK